MKEETKLVAKEYLKNEVFTPENLELTAFALVEALTSLI